jgi:hypothetical protein
MKVWKVFTLLFLFRLSLATSYLWVCVWKPFCSLWTPCPTGEPIRFCISAATRICCEMEITRGLQHSGGPELARYMACSGAANNCANS